MSHIREQHKKLNQTASRHSQTTFIYLTSMLLIAECILFEIICRILVFTQNVLKSISTKISRHKQHPNPGR